MGGCWGYVETRYTVDTIYAGKNCKKLAQLTRCKNIIGGPVWDTYADKYTYEENGVVFFYGLTGNHCDTLFNFNTPVNGNWQTSNTSTPFIHVYDKGIKIISGDTLEWLAINYTFPDNNSIGLDTVYERIGIKGPHYAFINPALNQDFTEPSVFGLCSYQDSTFSLFGNPDSMCTHLPNDIPVINVITFELSPNPFKDRFVLKTVYKDEFTYIVNDAYGRRMKEERCSGNLIVDTRSWSSGFYYCMITNKNGEMVRYKLRKE